MTKQQLTEQLARARAQVAILTWERDRAREIAAELRETALVLETATQVLRGELLERAG